MIEREKEREKNAPRTEEPSAPEVRESRDFEGEAVQMIPVKSDDEQGVEKNN